jgi:signal transduction histidine kinase
MSFEAEKEFASIRDTFNKMAERLEEIQVEKRLLELNKQRMIADISHDLKTPITSILGFSKLLNEDENIDNEDKNRYTHYIYQKSSYVAELIDELFEISKLEDEKYKFTYIRTDTAEWLRQIISEIYPEIENKDMELDVTICEAPVILDIDVNQMKRAVLNLINNALKYNPKKTVLRIYCNKEAGNAIVRISDNGEGIPKELKDSIFEPFVYKDKSGSNSRSTGLGLAISKRIIERHNGSISLSSNNEDITVFTIVLPLSEI